MSRISASVTLSESAREMATRRDAMHIKNTDGCCYGQKEGVREVAGYRDAPYLLLSKKLIDFSYLLYTNNVFFSYSEIFY